MSLELLLGPSQMVMPIVGNTESSKTPFWLDSLGLCGYYLELDGVTQTQTLPYSIFQYDGKGHIRHYGGGDGSFHYDFQTENLIHSAGSVVSFFDPFTGTVIPSTTTLNSATRYFDRYLRGQSASIQFTPLAEPFTWVEEYELVTPPGRNLASQAHISDYGGGLLALGYPNNGDIYIYDPVAKVQVGEWKSINLANSGIWYDRRLGVWISRHIVIGPPDEVLRVWADEARPATISTPVALQAIARGKVSDIRVQVLGDATDPVVGQLVQFELVSGPGALLNLQALTDVNGYAISQYNCPVSASGAANIQAQTVF